VQPSQFVEVNLAGTQCPACKEPRLRQVRQDVSSDDICDKGILCDNCGRSYDVLWGVPYLGTFRQEEILGLLEIAAVSDVFSIRNKRKIRDYLSWITLIDEYFLSSHPEQVLREHGIDRKPDWFENRLSEHKWFRFLTASIELAGKQALDVGAATGYDSLKLSSAGSKVTALEFNPVLSGIGSYSFPQLRWFSGAAHNLPFSDEQFDIVLANAALHHFTDIPQSLSEMLRVLKKDGYMITISDSFGNDSMTEDQESVIFNNEPSVLSGVNEQVPRFGEFVKTLKSLREDIEVRIFTQGCNNNLSYPYEWQVDEAYAELPRVNGALALLVRKKSSVMVVQPAIGAEIIRPSEFARTLEKGSFEVDMLVDGIPEKYIDLPLCDERYSRFRLLNGWKMHIAGDSKRGAYGRARMFYSAEKADKKSVLVSILVPYVQDCDTPTFIVKINNRKVFEKNVHRGMWHELLVPMNGDVVTNRAFALELQMKTDLQSADAKLFYVRKIEFGDDIGAQARDEIAELEHFGLESLVNAGLIGPAKTCLMLSSDYENGVAVVNKLRKLGLRVEVVVASGQEPFYSCLPDTRVSDSYPHPFLKRKTATKFKPKSRVELISASDIRDAKYLYGMTAADGTYRIYLILPGGHAKLLDAKLVKEDLKDFPSNSSASHPLNALSQSELQLITKMLAKMPFLLPFIKKILSFFLRR
jgi:ubiquinone/menaquinone biosynthesis C-methylase UbiE/uncharacterized protein YbaR (Trm112 family)